MITVCDISGKGGGNFRRGDNDYLDDDYDDDFDDHLCSPEFNNNNNNNNNK